MSPVYGKLGGVSGKGIVIAIGGLSFMAVPVSLLVTVPCLKEPDCTSGWGWWLVILYLLQGSGRSVYESTNKAVFADFFVGSKTEGAFANNMLQGSIAFAISYFMQVVLKKGYTLEIIIIVFSALMVVMYPLAKCIHSRRAQLEEKSPRKLEDESQEVQGDVESAL